MGSLIIIGGGASGLMAAAICKNATVLERADRVGKKILATGNGRCNLTNKYIAPEYYHSADIDAVAAVLSHCPLERVLDTFSEMGLVCRHDEAGRYYPYSNQANAVLDVLRNRVEAHSKIITGFTVQSVRYDQRRGRFEVTGSAQNSAKQTLYAERLIVSTGGGEFDIAKALGHSITPLYPALVQLVSDKPNIKSMSGLRVHATATLCNADQILTSRRGEILFTDFGLSGIAIFDLSGYAAPLLTQKRHRLNVRLDLAPDMDEDALLSLLKQRRSDLSGVAADRLLIGFFSKMLGIALFKEAGIKTSPEHKSPEYKTVRDITNIELLRLAEIIKNFYIGITGTKGFESAQVTGGGVRLNEFDTMTMASRLQPGLYVTGEALDVYGDCGGFNLHWAWVTGLLAGCACKE